MAAAPPGAADRPARPCAGAGDVQHRAGAAARARPPVADRRAPPRRGRAAAAHRRRAAPAGPGADPAVDLSLFGDRALAAAADLSRLPARGRGGDAEGEEGGAGDSVAAYGPGEGPGGQRLYNAEWQREPTSSELDGYVPGGAPAGAWALIACRTIPDYQVDNCRVLGESPVGSQLGSAMRQAAWQFRVRPPRRGGKTLIGAWVRIRIDFGKLPS